MSQNLDRIYNQITADLAECMFGLIRNYPGHEAEIARLMTAQLGSYIAVATKEPQQALVFYANRLAHFDWGTVRSDYFANTLGVDGTRAAPKPLAEVRSIGRADYTGPEDDSLRGGTEPVRNRDAHVGPPGSQKPSE